jgi:hypothetical protein
MSSLLAPTDALAESQRLLMELERRLSDLPFAEAILELHRPAHHKLEASHVESQQSVAAWRAALARRWDCEVAGRRLYKRILRQFVEFYGPAAPEVQLLSRGEAEAQSSPAELLTDLRRLQAALAMGAETLPFAVQRAPEVDRACVALEGAISEALLWETRRRDAALDSRMAQEAYRRVRNATRHALREHYGEHAPTEFGELFC